MKRNVLVLGGNGFIGQNICEKFAAEGYRVIAFDIADAHKQRADIFYVKGRIDDTDTIKEALTGMDVVIHLASATNPQLSMEKPEAAYREIGYIEKLCSVCCEQKVKRIVFASSGGTVYGDACPAGGSLAETSTPHPKNNYAISKLAMESVLSMYNEVYGMDNIILRISNPYGVGQNPKCRVGAITVFADHIIKEEPLHLFAGEDYVRDYINIEDVVEAFYLAALWQNEERISPLFNIGSGIGISMGELVTLISNTLNKKAIVNYEPPRSFDVKYNVLNIEKAERFLKYRPQSDVLQKICQYVLDLSKENRDEKI